MRTTITISAAAVVGMSTFAHAEPTLRLFGDPWNDFIHPFAISADGRVPAGYLNTLKGSSGGKWTPRQGNTAAPQALSNGVLALSHDGVVATGIQNIGVETFASVWYSDGSILGIEGLLPGGPELTIGWAVSQNGEFVAGGSRSAKGYEAIVWSSDTGTTALGTLGPTPGGVYASEAHWVGDDGRRARGISLTHDEGWAVFEWTPDAGMHAITNSIPSHPNRLPAPYASPDGTAMAGLAWRTASNGSGERYAFLWTETQGFEVLPSLLGGLSLRPYGVADGARVVVGDQGTWTREEGLRSLNDRLAEDFEFIWTESDFTPTAVSADGNTITGIAFIELPEGWIQIGFVYTFDNPCPADLNRDGRADFFDLADFLRAFTTGDLFADENLDGRLDFFDIQQYLNALAGGCP